MHGQNRIKFVLDVIHYCPEVPSPKLRIQLRATCPAHLTPTTFVKQYQSRSSTQLTVVLAPSNGRTQTVQFHVPVARTLTHAPSALLPEQDIPAGCVGLRANHRAWQYDRDNYSYWLRSLQLTLAGAVLWKGDSPSFVTSHRCIPVKNTFALSAVVFCACDIVS